MMESIHFSGLSRDPAADSPAYPSMQGAVLTADKTIWEDSLQQELSADLSLAEYYGDTDKVLFYTARPVLLRITRSDGRPSWEGEVRFTALLRGVDGNIRAAQISAPFESSLDLPDFREDMDIMLQPQVSMPVCRLTSPRKLSARCRLTLQGSVRKNSEYPPARDETMNAAQEESIQRKMEPITTLCTASHCEQDIQVSDDIELESALPEAAEVIFAEVTICPQECKTSSDSIQFRGEAIVRGIYRSEDGQYTPFCRRMPLAESFALPSSPLFIQNDAVITANAQVGDLQIRPAENSYGEKRILEVDFTYQLDLCCLCNQKQSYVADLYSTVFPCSATQTETSLPRLIRSSRSNFSVSESRTRSDLGINDAESVVYASSHLQNMQAKPDASRNRCVIDGEAEVMALLRGPQGISGLRFPVALHAEIDAPGITEDTVIHCDTQIGEVRGRLDTGNFSADFEVLLSLVMTQQQPTPLITSLNAQPDAPFPPQPSILLYYPSQQDSLWDIAKHYHVSPDTLRQENNLSGDRLSDSCRVLRIPTASPNHSAAEKKTAFNPPHPASSGKEPEVSIG